jgi:very-short-patch-repair endonuclease
MKTGSRRRIPDQHRDYARAMRADSTKAESMLWKAIRNKQLEGFKVKRQVPIENYIVDFVCFDARLIIEVDGSQHTESEYDKQRDAELSQAGFRILRFWNDEVTKNLDGACRHILIELRNTGE